MRIRGYRVEETSRQVTWGKTITGPDSDGSVVQIKNNLLSRAQLIKIGKNIVEEMSKDLMTVNVNVPGQPHLRRGMKLQLKGTIDDGLGNTFVLDSYIWFVIAHSITYDESSKQPVYESHITAVTWV